ncbi:MAG: SPOR domain-containing protein [Flavobacteriales bacterium]
MISNELGHIVSKQLNEQPLAVLPGFGGFVKDHVGAQLDELRNRIHPPKNTVVFNARLVHNDGLLVASVSADSDITYAEADMWLTDAISELKFRLDNTETVSWEGLGQLKKSVDGVIEFHAVDVAEIQDEFFGLKPVALRPVEKDNVDKARELVAVDGPVIKTIRTIPLKKVASYAAAAVFAGLLIWTPINTDLLSNGKTLVHQMNPFATNSNAVYSPRSFNDAWLAQGFEKEDALSDKFQKEYLNLYLTKNTANPIVVKTDAIPSEEVAIIHNEPIAELPKEASSYQVIAATFSSKSDAADYVAKMIKRGFGAEYAGTENSKHLVAYGTYNSIEDAQKMLSSVSLSNKEARIVSND